MNYIERHHERNRLMMLKASHGGRPLSSIIKNATDFKKRMEAVTAERVNRKISKLKRLAQWERIHNAEINRYNYEKSIKYEPCLYAAKIDEEFGDDQVFFIKLLEKHNVCIGNGCNYSSYTSITHLQIKLEDLENYKKAQSIAMMRKAEVGSTPKREPGKHFVSPVVPRNHSQPFLKPFSYRHY